MKGSKTDSRAGCSAPLYLPGQLNKGAWQAFPTPGAKGSFCRKRRKISWPQPPLLVHEPGLIRPCPKASELGNILLQRARGSAPVQGQGLA